MDWVFPGDVRGWLSEQEGRALAELARGKRVLEIGSFCGKSTICMAQTAESVDCIDPFDGRATAEPGDTFMEWIANTARYGVSDKAFPHRGTTADLKDSMKGPYDLVFVDGDHSYSAVMEDLRASDSLLGPGGIVAVHDYRRSRDPDVTKAVDAWISGGASLVELVDTIAIVQPPRRLPAGAVRIPRKVENPKPVVFLGLPSYDGKVSIGAAESYFLTPTRGDCVVIRSRSNSSFLTKTFNDLWCAALNAKKQGITHFAMIHADIMPAQPGWLDILMKELIRLDADVVSAVSPIKSEHGWTSTAIAVDGIDREPWIRRRLTMQEIYDLPETFGAEDVGAPLLLNTGLWVCRLDRPWCEQVCFDVFNRICRSANGEWHAEAIPEDWLFSAALNRLGCSIYATRKVTLGHDGGKVYTTDHAWGSQKTDEIYQQIAERRRGMNRAEDQVRESASGEGDDLGSCAIPEAAAS